MNLYFHVQDQQRSQPPTVTELPTLDGHYLVMLPR